jgi:hypothetical protein
MSLGLWVPLCATFIIVTIAVLRFGWPTLRWRSYNKVHGNMRIIEFAVMLSRAGVASRYALGSFGAARRLVQRAPGALRGRPPRSANAAATLEETYADRYSDTNPHPRHDAGERIGDATGAAPCAAVAPRRAAQAAECVIYVTLKVGNH